MIFLENERMRVRARVLLVGRSRVGRALLGFSVMLRAALRLLAVLLAVKAAVLVVTAGGRFILFLGVFTVVSAFLLCECARTVRDRWYLAVSEDKPVSVARLILGFNFADFLFSVKIGVLARFYSFLRLSVFLLFPLGFAAFTLAVGMRGASYAVMGVLAAGSFILLVCGVAFAGVSLSCVRLARTLCCYDSRCFKLNLGRLEADALKLFGYSITLGFFNTAYRRTAKLLLAHNVIKSDV